VRDEGGVGPVGRDGEALEERQVPLCGEARRGADRGDQRVDLGRHGAIESAGPGAARLNGDVLERVAAVNVGLAGFGEAARAQGAPVADVDWRPPAGGDPETLALLERLWGRHGDRVAEANAEALRRLEATRPHATSVRRAGDVIPGLGERTVPHSGPPIEPHRLCGPQRRAVEAACVLEGWAPDVAAAGRLLDAGDVALASGNEHGHVGPMAGVCSPSVPVWVVEDESSGTRAFSTLNEGPGHTTWFGVNDEDALGRLRFLRDEAGPHLARLLERVGAVDVLRLAAEGLHMGDDLHMRTQAAGNLLIRRLAPGFAALGGEAVARFVGGNHLFFLNLTMAAAKCSSLAATTPGSTLVSLLSRNGRDMAVQVAGLPGRWHTAPAAPVQDALLREGYGPEDAGLDIGDSAVIECIGLGGMAVAAAPAVAAFFSGTVRDAVARTRLMGEICLGRASRFTIPALDFVGTPVGIDARLVVELGIGPQITTGVVHEKRPLGQIGAGVAHQPIAPFRAALESLADALDQGP
jgi:hypothetical protein